MPSNTAAWLTEKHAKLEVKSAPYTVGIYVGDAVGRRLQVSVDLHQIPQQTSGP